MFDVPSEKIGATASALTVYSLPFSLLTTLFISYAFEILGRRWTLFLSFASTAALYYVIPYTAGNFPLLVTARCAVGVTMSAPISHPLVADYVHKKSRGGAVALLGMGLVLGEVTAMGVLFNLTKSMNFRNAFAVSSLAIAGFAAFFLIAVRDPDLTYLRRGLATRLQGEQAGTGGAFEALTLS